MIRIPHLALVALATPLALSACTAAETSPEGAGSASPSSPAMSEDTAISQTPPTPESTRTGERTVPPSSVAAGETDIDLCGAGKVRTRWTGAVPSAETKAEIAEAVGERRIRYYTDGDPITMDFSQQRLNVVLDKDGRIAQFRCG